MTPLSKAVLLFMLSMAHLSVCAVIVPATTSVPLDQDLFWLWVGLCTLGFLSVLFSAIAFCLQYDSAIHRPSPSLAP